MVQLFVMLGAVLGGTPAAAAVPVPAPPRWVATIDVNRASLDDLLAFPGIGRQYAEKILASRPYATRHELVERQVLPPHVYAALRSKLEARPIDDGRASRALDAVPAGMIDLNTADRQALLAVPGVGIRYADRIIAGRPYRSEFELVGRGVLPRNAFDRAQNFVAVQH